MLLTISERFSLFLDSKSNEIAVQNKKKKKGGETFTTGSCAFTWDEMGDIWFIDILSYIANFYVHVFRCGKLRL